jgi:hypothetical protein
MEDPEYRAAFIAESVRLSTDEPVPFLPADPEEQRRLDAKASDGTQCMIYRGH